MCKVLKMLDLKPLKHITFREPADSMVVETSELVLALNKKLEKAHIALKDLEVGLTLDVPGGPWTSSRGS
uniref:Uncharacterized protein n=1 Tax=Thermogladius calderae TaxID=1200300 RepID=A0A7J3Y0V3_9CREN